MLELCPGKCGGAFNVSSKPRVLHRSHQVLVIGHNRLTGGIGGCRLQVVDRAKPNYVFPALRESFLELVDQHSHGPHAEGENRSEPDGSTGEVSVHSPGTLEFVREWPGDRYVAKCRRRAIPSAKLSYAKTARPNLRTGPVTLACWR